MNRKIALIFLCAIIKKKERCELYYDLLTKNNQLSAMSYRHQQLLWRVLVYWELTDIVLSFHINKLENHAATHTMRRRRRGVN